MNRQILKLASVLSLLRGEVTARGIAERFGVTEAQVLRWKDVFEIAGMLALAEVLGGPKGSDATKKGPRKSEPCAGSEPTTFACILSTTTAEPTNTAGFSEPTTTPEPTTRGFGEPTTTPEPTTRGFGEPTTTPEPTPYPE